MSDKCHECGMPVSSVYEYHPYAACLMFKACHDSGKVRENLEAVLQHGAEESSFRLQRAEGLLRDANESLAIYAEVLTDDECGSEGLDDLRSLRDSIDAFLGRDQ